MHRWLDRAIVALGFASVLVFALAATAALAGPMRGALVAVDLAIVVAYALAFLAKGLLDENPARWFRRHAWLAVALLPLTVPILVAQPWFLLVQVVVVLVRAAKALDRALHLRVMSGLTERYRARVMEEVTQPLLLHLADALEESLVARDYAKTLGASLASRRELLEGAIHRGLASNPRLSRLSRLPPVARFVDDTTRDVVDAAQQALASEETNALVRSAVRDAFRELRAGIAEPKWPHKGIGLGEAAHRVAEAAHLAPRAAAVAVVAPGADR